MTGSICHVNNCKNGNSKGIKENPVTLFHVPTHKPEELQKWENILATKFSKTRKINNACELHFQICDIKKNEILLTDDDGKILQEVRKL